MSSNYVFQRTGLASLGPPLNTALVGMGMTRAKVLGFVAGGFALGSVAVVLVSLIGDRSRYVLAGILAICALGLGMAAWSVFRQEEPDFRETIVGVGPDGSGNGGGDGGD